MTGLLERGDLLARLEETRRDGGRLAFVGGEAGVGKTALVRAFGAETGGRVAYGACENVAAATPLGPFFDLAGALGGSLGAALRADCDARDAARALLAELTAATVVVLEDVHWADQATLDALRILGRRVDTTGGLVLATYRDDETRGDHPLRLVLGELASAPGVVRITVPPLSGEAVDELAAPHGVDGASLFRVTQGNAFFVTEILAAGAERLPETVRDAVLARVASLSSSAKRLLDVVALVPVRTELWLLEAVAAGELGHLDECLSGGILREDGHVVSFRHELARLAVESTVPAQRRRAIHAELVRSLAATPFGRPDPSRLAHHADGADDVAAVLQFAPGAAREAVAAGAHREAAGQYQRALRYADGLGASDRAELLEAFAEEAGLMGRYAETIEAHREAIALFRTLGDRAAEGLALSKLAVPYVNSGLNAQAEEAGRAAVELLETLPPSRALASAYAVQSYLRMLSRDNAEGVAWGERAVAAAESLGDCETLSVGLNMIGTSYLMSGEIDRGIGYLMRSLEVARAEALELRISSALGMLGSGLGEMYELARAESYLREHLAFADEHDLWPMYSRSWLALVDVYRGRWDAGAAGALAVIAESPETISRISALIALGRVRARRGDPGASEVLDEALELARPGGHLQRLGHVRAARAEAAWLAGDAAGAIDEAGTVLVLAVEKRHLWFTGELLYWRWKAGAEDEWPDWVAEPYRLQHQGRAAEAARLWTDRGCPYEAARALAECDDDRSLTLALADLERLGAGPASRVVRQRLRDLGAPVPRGPRSTTRANPAGLTARELDVLRLVAAGKRNVDVAAELVVSTRTVDHHVSAILRKLGARTRGEAAAAAAELGLIEAQ